MSIPDRLVFYDGDCGLCQRSVQWLLDHDTEGTLCFAPLQGETAAVALAERNDLPEGTDSIVYLEEGRLFLRSRALVRLATHLDPKWRWLRHFRLIPAFLADLGYRFVAAIRHRVWGHGDACRIPTHVERSRFLP